MNITYIGRRQKQTKTKTRKVMVQGWKTPAPRTEGFGFRNGIAWFKAQAIPGTNLDELCILHGYDQGWEELCSNWMEQTRAGDLIDDGVTFGMAGEETHRGFVPGRLCRCSNGKTYKENTEGLFKTLKAENLHREMEILDCEEILVGETDPVIEMLSSVLADEVGPYDLEPLDIHRDTFLDLIQNGASWDQAVDWAGVVNLILNKRYGGQNPDDLNDLDTEWRRMYEAAKASDNPELAARAYKLGQMYYLGEPIKDFADEPTSLSFEPVVEAEGDVIDLKGERWADEAQAHIAEQAALRRAESAWLNPQGKRPWGWLEHLTKTRQERFEWLGRYLLSCKSREEVVQARKRLVEAIELNNTQCRKMQALGHKEAWVAAILAPEHKSDLMALAKSLINGDRPLGHWSRPPAHKQPWMPAPISLEEVAKLLRPAPTQTFPITLPTKRVPRKTNIE